MKFSIKENADLVTFTEEILTEKFFVQWTYKRLSPTISISFADTCTETYLEHLQTSKMECWSTIVSIFYPLTIVAVHFVMNGVEVMNRFKISKHFW